MLPVLLAWVVMPKLMRRCHKYITQDPSALRLGSILGMQLYYEKSFWGALEDPLRYLITFMAIAKMVTPTAIALKYIAQAWRLAVIFSFVWFLHRCTANMIIHALSSQSLLGFDEKKTILIKRISAFSFVYIGVLALAIASNVHSIRIVGGIVGMFAATNFHVFVYQVLKAIFSGKYYKKGRVVVIGLTVIILRSNDGEVLVSVPNEVLLTQEVVNKSCPQSCPQWHTMTIKIPIKVNEFDKVLKISNDIESMLRLSSKVFMGMGAPYCFLTRMQSSFTELLLICNLKSTVKSRSFHLLQELFKSNA
ncbi:hypothetical protein QYF36_009925 [Acer negundo]|nr:hypothetical protein QYF36_009925 [Acer negundo]